MKQHFQSGWISRTVRCCDTGKQKRARCACIVCPDEILIFYKGFHRRLTRLDCFLSFEAFWSREFKVAACAVLLFPLTGRRSFPQIQMNPELIGRMSCLIRLCSPRHTSLGQPSRRLRKPRLKMCAWSFFSNKSSVAENKVGWLWSSGV